MNALRILILCTSLGLIASAPLGADEPTPATNGPATPAPGVPDGFTVVNGQAYFIRNGEMMPLDREVTLHVSPKGIITTFRGREVAIPSGQVLTLSASVSTLPSANSTTSSSGSASSTSGAATVTTTNSGNSASGAVQNGGGTGWLPFDFFATPNIVVPNTTTTVVPPFSPNNRSTIVNPGAGTARSPAAGARGGSTGAVGTGAAGSAAGAAGRR